MGTELHRPELAFLARLEVTVDDVVDLGATDAGHRRIANIDGGTVTGDRFAGVVLPGGADWQVVLGDGTVLVETRYNLRAHDGALVHIRTSGLRTGEPAALDALARGEEVDPADYYFRTSATFETGDERYRWMTRAVTVCSCARLPTSVLIDAYTVS